MACFLSGHHRRGHTADPDRRTWPTKWLKQHPAWIFLSERSALPGFTRTGVTKRQPLHTHANAREYRVDDDLLATSRARERVTLHGSAKWRRRWRLCGGKRRRRCRPVRGQPSTRNDMVRSAFQFVQPRSGLLQFLPKRLNLLPSGRAGNRRGLLRLGGKSPHHQKQKKGRESTEEELHVLPRLSLQAGQA